MSIRTSSLSASAPLLRFAVFRLCSSTTAATKHPNPTNAASLKGQNYQRMEVVIVGVTHSAEECGAPPYEVAREERTVDGRT